MSEITITEQFCDILVDHPRKIILSDTRGEYSAQMIYNCTQGILSLLGNASFKGKRIAVFCHPGLSYTASMLAGWMSGAMMVPLCITHPESELLYVLEDSGAELIIADAQISAQLPKTRIKTLTPDFNELSRELTPANYNNPLPEHDALMLYTSGTTGKPKGVVHTHSSLSAQISCLVQAWEWTEDDRILHFLPLHHTHGIVNKWLCALWTGARCDMLEKFDAEDVWKRIRSGSYSLFMAVPTVYAKLTESVPSDLKVEDLSSFRLMVSGSAALPVPLLNKWKVLTGHFLLERYGMTETGMVLSNPLHGERRAGTVGQVLPGMEVRIVVEEGEESASGELQVRGRNIFRTYWNRDKETKSAFTKDGWFRTGDRVREEEGYYRIEGRFSQDILKSGGYKISALEIESALLEHPGIKECAVIGLPDETWGQVICAVIAGKSSDIAAEQLKQFLKDRLASYKIPSEWHFVDELPRNAMGKVVKKELAEWVRR